MAKENAIVYESPDMEIMQISSEGILCASINYDTQESYLGDDEFETLF